jgi:hypothetical protein
MEEPEIRERWWCAGRALADGTATLGESDRAEGDPRKEGGGEEVTATRTEVVVNGRVGVWRSSSSSSGRSRLGEGKNDAKRAGEKLH